MAAKEQWKDRRVNARQAQGAALAVANAGVDLRLAEWRAIFGEDGERKRLRGGWPGFDYGGGGALTKADFDEPADG